MLHQTDLRQTSIQLSDKLIVSKNNPETRSNRKLRDGMVRETFILPRDQAREKAKAWLDAYPAAAYWSRVEDWEVQDDGQIKFTMIRLPHAD